MLGDPAKVEVVQRIFKMYTEEERGFRAIADQLNRDGVATPRGPAWSDIYHGQWTDTTIRAILVNLINAGDMVWNRRTDGRFHMIVQGQAAERKGGPRTRLVPNQPSNWITVRDAHPSIVPRRLFEQARKLRETRPASASQRGRTKRPTGGWEGQRSRFILSGLLQCARCRNRYQGDTCAKSKRRKDGSVVKTYSYACGGYITKGATVYSLGPVNHATLETKVIDAVLAVYRPYLQPAGRKELIAAVRQVTGKESLRTAQRRRHLTARQVRITNRICNLLDNITPTNRQFVDQRIIELRSDLERIQSELVTVTDSRTSQTELISIIEQIEQFTKNLESNLRNCSSEDKMASLRQCVLGIKIDATVPIATLTIQLLHGVPSDEIKIPFAD